MSLQKLVTIGISALLLGACASSKIKERKEQRDKVAVTSKMYCEFLDGGVYPDMDVALNIEMAKRCDFEKPYTMTQYNSRSDSTGIVYCCSVAAGKMTAPATKKAADKKESLED